MCSPGRVGGWARGTSTIDSSLVFPVHRYTNLICYQASYSLLYLYLHFCLLLYILRNSKEASSEGGVMAVVGLYICNGGLMKLFIEIIGDHSYQSRPRGTTPLTHLHLSGHVRKYIGNLIVIWGDTGHTHVWIDERISHWTNWSDQVNVFSKKLPWL